MAKYYVGCDEVTKGWSRYFDLCSALEVPWQADDRPTIKTMNTWRVSSPKGFAFIPHVQPAVVDALVAHGARGAKELSADFAELWAPTGDRARALAARAVLVSTPFDFTPTPTNRALLADFGKRLADLGFKTPVIWENTGMWEPEDSAEVARKAGLTYLQNPFSNFEGELQLFGKGGDLALTLSERGGTRRHFDTYDMEQLIDGTMNFDRVYVMLRGQYKWRHARELKLLLDSME